MQSHISDMKFFFLHNFWFYSLDCSFCGLVLLLLETQFFPSVQLLVTDLSLHRQYIWRCFGYFSEAADMLQNNEVLTEIASILQIVEDQNVFPHSLVSILNCDLSTGIFLTTSSILSVKCFLFRSDKLKIRLNEYHFIA